MLKNPFINTIVITICLAALCACSAGGYQRLEEKSLPRYQTGTPVMSDLKVMCRAKVEHQPGRFNLYYNDLWDVTIYPTPPNIPPRYNPNWCENGQSTSLSTKVITNPNSPNAATRPDNPTSVKNLPPNTDPAKGAVNLWPLMARLSIDGLNYRATMVYFQSYIMEGDKLPLGGNFTALRTSPFTKKDTVIINGREWQHMKVFVIYGKDVPAQGKFYKAGETSEVEELYTTKINDNYTFMMFARYDQELAQNAPDWLAKRQAFLRHWLESFKFEPISSVNYSHPSKEDTSTLKGSDTKPHSAPTNPDKSRGVLSAPVK